MNTFKNGNSFHRSDISEQNNLCNSTNTNAAVSFAEYSDFSENNISLSRTPQTSLFSSYCYMNTLEKGNSVHHSDISEQEKLRNFTNTNAAVSFAEYSD